MALCILYKAQGDPKILALCYFGLGECSMALCILYMGQGDPKERALFYFAQGECWLCTSCSRPRETPWNKLFYFASGECSMSLYILYLRHIPKAK